MTCTRCGGPYRVDSITDGRERLPVWVCVHCGDVVDAAIVGQREYRRVHGVPPKPRFPGRRRPTD